MRVHHTSLILSILSLSLSLSLLHAVPRIRKEHGNGEGWMPSYQQLLYFSGDGGELQSLHPDAGASEH